MKKHKFEITRDPLLTFDEASHIYKYDSEVVPSVTSLFKTTGMSNYDDVEEHILASACEKGKFIHIATEKFDNGTLDWQSIKDEDYFPYVLAWELFVKQNVKKIGKEYQILAIEEPIYHKELRYAGTLDRIMVLNDGCLTLGEIKTGTDVPETIGMQKAAYRNGAEAQFGIKIERSICVHLQPLAYTLYESDEAQHKAATELFGMCVKYYHTCEGIEEITAKWNGLNKHGQMMATRLLKSGEIPLSDEQKDALREKVARRAEIKAAASEYKKLDKEIKAIAEGHDEIDLGTHLISGKYATKLAYSYPQAVRDKYARNSIAWKGYTNKVLVK